MGCGNWIRHATTTDTMILFGGKFGNTCYCNSVLQALYFCEPFRKHVLAYDRERKERLKFATDKKNQSNGSSSGASNGGIKSAVKGRLTAQN